MNKNKKFILKLKLSLRFSSEITVESLSRFDNGEKYPYLRTELNNSSKYFDVQKG